MLADADAAAALGDAGLSLGARGGQVRTGRDEALNVTKDGGEVAATSGAPLMWDAEADAARPFPLTLTRPGEPARVLSPMPDWANPNSPTPGDGAAGSVSPEDADPVLVADPLAQAAPVGREVQAAGEVAQVQLVPDAEFLADAETVFPVVVDPSVSISVGFDTYVQSGTTTDTPSATELRLGTYNSGTNVARSFLQFYTSAIAGKSISAARLDLYAYHSWSCTARNWQVWHTGSVSTATRWTAQPSWLSHQSTSSATAGYSSSCPDAWTSADVKNIVAYAADNSHSQLTLGVKAESETDSYGWKRFYSADNGAYIPSLWVTYNSYPSAPTYAWIEEGQYYWGPDPATGARTLYIRTRKPTLSATVSDPDGGTVRGQFSVLAGSTTVWNKATGTAVASGGRSTFTPTSSTPDLVDGTTYTARMWSYDGALTSKSYYVPWSSFTVDVTDPAAPAISASAFTDGGWVEDVPASNTFTFTSTSMDVMRFEYAQDGGAWTSLPATTSGSTRTASLDWVASGAHTLKVRAFDKANRVSAVTTFTFGTGGATMTSPSGGAKSTDTFRVTAAAPAAGSGTVTPSVHWRIAGKDNVSGWNTTTGTVQGWELAKTLPAVAANAPVNVDTTFSAAAAAVQSRTPVLIDVQVCFTYNPDPDSTTTRCTWVSDDPSHASHVSVLRVPHAFGDSFPEAGAGPGKVALWTGEFSTTATDVSIATPKDVLSISRTYASFGGPTTIAAGVFGPGWAANLDGSAFGSAGYEVIDSTGVDGTIALVDGDGQALVYRQPGATATARKQGPFTPVDEDTAALGARLELEGTGTTAQLRLVEEDGTVTTWTLHGQGAAAAWVAVSVAQAGAVGTTTFARDESSGRITRILAPAPDGVTCPAEGALPAGCRALRLVYATTTTATTSTPGDFTGRLTAVFSDAYNPDKPGGAGMDSVQVAAYTYTDQGYLASVVDPRSGLGTSYTYTAPPSGLAAPQVATITPTGLAAWHLTYATTSQGSHGLARVARDPAAGTGTPVVQAAFVYGINPATTTNGLPDLRSQAVTAWDQATAPTWGAAVFGPNHPVSTVDPGGISAADWAHASLQYTDAQGRVVNTAAHGAGAWQVTSTDYDTGGRVIRILDERAIDQIRTLRAAGASVDSDSYATITRYNADITATAEITHAGGTIAAGTVLTPAGTLVTDTWTPAAPSGSGELVRVHTRTEYDQGAPNSGVNPATGLPYRLPTTVTTTAAAASAGTPNPGEAIPAGESVLTQHKSGYDPIDGSSTTGPTSGWTLGVATSSTIVMDGQGDITTRTAYNSAGQVVQTRQPKSNGSDAGTTLSVYYTAGANSADAACGDSPQYAGLACAVKTGEATPTIATTRTTGYSMYAAPRVVTETLGGASRTTTSTYTVDGRVDTVTTVTSGVSGSTPVPATKTVYSATTGLPTATVSLTGDAQQPTITIGYDGWGRVVSYTDTGGQVTTTTYDTGGRVATTSDPTGTITYGYDGTDAAGRAEHRGLVTAVSVTNAGQGALAMGAAYDAAGAVTLQSLPGGVEQTRSYDRAGRLTDLAYTGNGVGGRSEWFAFTHTHDADGDITADTAPGRARTFTYDRAQRLTQSTDTITTPGDPAACTTRGYGFDTNGNRTTATTATGQACTTAGATTRTWTHDSADRVLTGANSTGTYTYDALGRQTTLPGVDTPAGTAAGDLSIGYYDTDAARTLTQDGTSTTYQLDPAARRSASTTTDGTTTSTTVRYYGDASDNPAWATTTSSGTTSTTRYITAPAGGLALQITGTAPAVTVADGHGTIATTIPIPTTGDATTTTGWHRADEFGNKLTTAPATGTLAYAWHGQQERATDPTAIVLMGVRLYNPVTGLFTSRDPIPGGNTTTYTYPQDPINAHDLDGRAKKSWWGRNWRTVATYASIAACVVLSAIACLAVALGTALAVNLRHNRQTGWRLDGRNFVNDAAWALAGGAVGRAVAGSWRAAAVVRYSRPAPRHSTKHIPGGTVRRVNWPATRANMYNNYLVAMGGAAGANMTRPAVQRIGTPP